MNLSSRSLPLLFRGFLSGLCILGVGGRLIMRLIAHLTNAAPRFTPEGTLQVLALGAIWGALTAPLWPVVARSRSRWISTIGFTGVTFGLATLVFVSLTYFAGPVVASARLRVLAAILFPLLFLVHAVVLASSAPANQSVKAP